MPASAFTALVVAVLLFETCNADRRDEAQCKQVIPGVEPGELQCHPSQHDGHPGGSGYCGGNCFTTGDGGYNQTDLKKCNPDWAESKAFSCPDGIGPEGVFLSNKCFSWCAPHIYKGSLQGCDADSMLCGKAAVMKAGSQASVLLLHKRVKCKENDDDPDAVRCSVFKTTRCLDLGEKVFNSPWDSAVTHAELKIAAEKATQILRESRTCSLLTPFVPQLSINVSCTAQTPCVSNGMTCRGLDQPAGDGGCNRFCNGSTFRGDLGGCIKDACKCLTKKACQDTWVQGDDVCGIQCKHWSRTMYTKSNGWSGKIVIPRKHLCKTSVKIWDDKTDTWNDAKFARDKTMLF